VLQVGGMSVKLIGEANDYVGKGMAGGDIVIVPPEEQTLDVRLHPLLFPSAAPPHVSSLAMPHILPVMVTQHRPRLSQSRGNGHDMPASAAHAAKATAAFL
jgi:GXGXG motif